MVYGIFLTLILDLIFWNRSHFWPEIFCTRTTFLFGPHIFWSRTHPHNYFDFAPEVAKSIFVVAHPSGSLISHPVQVLVHRIFFFFFSNGVLRAPLVVQALRACTPDPFGVRYKNPFGIFIMLRKLRFLFRSRTVVSLRLPPGS